MTEHPRSTVFERTGSFGGLADLERRHEEHKRDIGALAERLELIALLLGEAPTPSPISTIASPEVPSTRPLAGDGGQGV